MTTLLMPTFASQLEKEMGTNVCIRDVGLEAGSMSTTLKNGQAILL
jgi:hypothetical protein